MACAGCQPDAPAGRTLRVQALSIAQCPVTARAVIELDALGDFEASNRTADSVPANATERELRFPLSTRAVRATATDGFERWLGVADVHGDSVDLALWLENRSCALYRADAGAYPSRLEGQSLGLSADGRILLVAGGTAGDAADTLTFDVGTSATGKVANGLRFQRAWASVTAFGSGFLIAGGEAPNAVARDADVVDATLAPSPAATIPLTTPRARHSAVVLPSGETLLVGGHDHDGFLLTTLEAVSPISRGTRIDLAALAVGRNNPTVIVLTDGRILVGGGSNVDQPVTTVEWLTADAERSARAPVDLADFGAAGALAFAALPGGAALAVGGTRAYWLSPEGLVDAFDLPAPVVDPLLIPASDGSPFLVTGPPEAQRVLRFNPWSQLAADRFVDTVIELTAPLPSSAMPLPVAIDNGAFLWLAPDGDGISLYGLRHDTRGVYTRDVALINQTDLGDPPRPLHVAPDWRSGADTLVYDGKLRLGGDGVGPTQRVATVFVTDATYASLDLTIDLEAGPPPLVLLGSTELGGPGCAWPELGEPPEKLRVLRRGHGVLLIRGSAQRTCEVDTARLSIGLKQGGAAPSVVTSLTLHREIQLE